MTFERVCVVGAGTIGSLCAAHIAQIADVSVLVRRDEQARALNENGLRVSGKSELVSELFATTNPAELADADLVIVATKATQLEKAVAPLEGRRGTTRTTQNMVLSGRHGNAGPEFKHPDPVRPVEPDDLLLYSVEVAGPSGYWAEFARPISQASLSPLTQRLMEAYQECFERARTALRSNTTAHDVHMSAFGPFQGLDVKPGHVTGHYIDMTMVAHPRIGEGWRPC